MSKLEDFLGLTDVTDIRKEITEVIGGKPFTFTVRPMTAEEHNEFQKRSRNFDGKKFSFNNGKFNSLCLDACIIEPNFANASFLEKVKCHTAAEFRNKKFPAGVLANIAEKIEKLSGFNALEEEVESAKN